MPNEIIYHGGIANRSLEAMIEGILDTMDRMAEMGLPSGKSVREEVRNYIVRDIREAAWRECEPTLKRMREEALLRGNTEGELSAFKEVLGWLDSGYTSERELRNLILAGMNDITNADEF